MATEPITPAVEQLDDPRTDRVTVERAKEILAKIDMPEAGREQILAEIALANELQDCIMAEAERIRTGESVSRDELFSKMNAVAEQHGCDYGIPYALHGSDKEHPLVLAKRSPLKMLQYNDWSTEAMQQWALRGYATRNSWERPGDISVTILNTEHGPFSVIEPQAGVRLRKIFAEFDIRQLTQQSVDAEEKALKSLRGKVNENQYRLYFLTGAFLEHSKRSDLHYVFRKGKPTLVISFHRDGGGRCIAALCMHPIGFYQFSHVGVMCPTDEVIAALLLMRGDEPRLWKVSGQWSASDSRSGI